MRNIINNTIQIVGIIYLFSAIFLIPILIVTLWDIFVDSRIDKFTAIATVLKIIFALVGGYLFFKMWLENGRRALESKIKSVAPGNFKPRFELHGCGVTEYIGIAPHENTIVIVDMKRNIARCEAMEFYQGWDVEEEGSFTFITIRFNSFEFPSIKFQIARRRKDEIIAKLNFAMKF